MLRTRPDTDTDTDLSLDSVCTLRIVVGDRPMCDRPTTWAVRFGCCGHVKAVCDGHRDLPGCLAPMKLLCAACRAQCPAVISRWPI